jgi:hypothetical protein
MSEIIMMSVCPPFRLWNQLTDFHEIWYELYYTGSHNNLVLFTVNNYDMTASRTCEVGATITAVTVHPEIKNGNFCRTCENFNLASNLPAIN